MKQLRRDPMGLLVAADDAAVRSMARRELLGEATPESSLAELPAVRRAVARQQRDGRWKYPGGNPDIRTEAPRARRQHRALQGSMMMSIIPSTDCKC